MIDGFLDRLCECLDTENVAEVSRQTGVPYNTLKNYAGETTRMPSSEVLMQIGRNTNVNLHYLLMGNGPCFVEESNEQGREDGAPERPESHQMRMPKGLSIEIPAIRVQVILENNDTTKQKENIPLYNAALDE